MTRKEKAATIRRNLKSVHGYTARQVSVSCNRGSAINVTIKSSTVKKHLVEAIANDHESISRCQASGEILSGANTYIFVSYARELLEARAAELIGRFSDEPGVAVEIEGFKVWRTNDYPSTYNIAAAGGDLNANLRPHGKQYAAETLAAVLFDGGFDFCGRWVS